MKINSDTKIEVKLGCANYLIDEVERLRSENRELQIETGAYKRILRLIEVLAPERGGICSGSDLLWQAKNEVCEGIKKVEEFLDHDKKRPERGNEGKDVASVGC